MGGAQKDRLSLLDKLKSSSDPVNRNSSLSDVCGDLAYHQASEIFFWESYRVDDDLSIIKISEISVKELLVAATQVQSRDIFCLGVRAAQQDWAALEGRLPSYSSHQSLTSSLLWG